MSFQAYLDNIETKTGKTTQLFRASRQEVQLTKLQAIVFGDYLGEAR